MMRPIDADALKSALEIEQYNDYDDLLRTEHLIDNAPTIKTFTLADIEEQYRKGLEKGLEERPHGEWKYESYGQYLSTYKCSNCGFHGDKQWISCPYCDAKMKEGETE